MNLRESFPSLNDMAGALAVSLDAYDVIQQDMYDYNLYPLLGSLGLTFFQTATGAGGLSVQQGNANNPKSLADTNMPGNGFFPAPQMYWVGGIEVVVDPGSSAVANTFALQVPAAFAAANAQAVQAGIIDVNRIRQSGALNFTVGPKSYYQEGPLLRYPSRNDFRLSAAVATTSATVGEVLKARYNCIGDPVDIAPGVGIVSMQNFGVTITWPALVATVTNNARIGVILRGWLWRGVQ